MAPRKIIVIGASAGGIVALQALVQHLPKDFPAAMLVVMHLSRNSSGLLPEILRRSGTLPASNARHDEEIQPGHIYVAPPDRHLLVGERHHIRIGHGPKENRFRPAVDPLFRSAALAYGPAAIGIILSGGLDDGTAGLCAIKQAGGIAIVQDPNEAETASMPRSALRHVKVDYCLPAAEIGEMLPRLVRETPVKGAAAMPEETRLEVQLAADERHAQDGLKLGDPSQYTCPECHGSLMRVRNATPVRFRCHTGHAFTSATLEDELRDKVETAAWNAIRALQEHAMLLQEMMKQPGFSNEEIAEYSKRAELALKRAQMLRESLALTQNGDKQSTDPTEQGSPGARFAF